MPFLTAPVNTRPNKTTHFLLTNYSTTQTESMSVLPSCKIKAILC